MIRSDAGLTLETSASLSSFDGNLAAAATFMCSLSQRRGSRVSLESYFSIITLTSAKAGLSQFLQCGSCTVQYLNESLFFFFFFSNHERDNTLPQEIVNPLTNHSLKYAVF